MMQCIWSQAVEEAPQEEAKPANPVSKDPRYAKFFKMLQFVSEPFDPALQMFHLISLGFTQVTLASVREFRNSL